MASLLIRGFALGFAIAASPGPIFFLCLRRGLLRGWLTGLVSGLGVATADATYAAVAVFGIAAVTSVLAGFTRWLALAGGLALVFIGIRSALTTPVTREATAPASTTGAGLAWAYASILGLTITNPATIISFAALAAALGSGLSGSWTRPALVVVGVGLGSTSWWLVMAAVVAALRTRVTPRIARIVGAVSGFAIAALGVLAVASALTSIW